MPGTILVVGLAHEPTCSALEVALSSAGFRVLVGDTDAAPQLVESRAVDLVIAGTASLPALREIDAPRVPVVVLCDRTDREAMAAMVCDHGIDHVVFAGLGELKPHELVVAAEQILAAAPLPAADYLAGDHQVEVRHLHHAAQRDALLDELDTYLRRAGARRPRRAVIATIADELITNALYNAPRTPDGTPRFAGTNRRTKVQLEPGERVRVAFGTDGDQLVLSVTDPFGSLSPAVIRRCLRRCLLGAEQIEQKAGGAGIGMYTTFMEANRFVFDIQPGRRTDAVVVIDLGRGGLAASHSRSLHILERETVAVPQTVSLSPSIKYDIHRHFVPHTAPRRRRVRARSSTRIAPLPVAPASSAPGHTSRRRATRPGGWLSATAAPLPQAHTMSIARSTNLDDALQYATQTLTEHFAGVVVLRQDNSGGLRPWICAGSAPLWIDPAQLGALEPDPAAPPPEAGPPIVVGEGTARKALAVPFRAPSGRMFVLCVARPMAAADSWAVLDDTTAAIKRAAVNPPPPTHRRTARRHASPAGECNGRQQRRRPDSHDGLRTGRRR